MSVWLRPVAGVVLVAAIAVRTTERRLVEALELAGAVTPENATQLSLTHFLKRWIFQRLLRAGVVGETAEQRQYLKVVEYAEWRARRRRRALILIPIIIAAGIITFYLTPR